MAYLTLPPSHRPVRSGIPLRSACQGTGPWKAPPLPKGFITTRLRITLIPSETQSLGSTLGTNA